MDRNINTIIEECVKKVLSEMDLVPTDNQGNANLIRKQSINAWRMIYRLMDNVKTKMDADWQNNGGNISNQNVDQVIDYIYNALRGITKNTIGRQ
jgi:hypothetical protein